MTDETTLSSKIDTALSAALDDAAQTGDDKKLTIKERMLITNTAIKWEAVKAKLDEGRMGGALLGDDDDDETNNDGDDGDDDDDESSDKRKP